MVHGRSIELLNLASALPVCDYTILGRQAALDHQVQTCYGIQEYGRIVVCRSFPVVLTYAKFSESCTPLILKNEGAEDYFFPGLARDIVYADPVSTEVQCK